MEILVGRFRNRRPLEWVYKDALLLDIKLRMENCLVKGSCANPAICSLVIKLALERVWPKYKKFKFMMFLLVVSILQLQQQFLFLRRYILSSDR